MTILNQENKFSPRSFHNLMLIMTHKMIEALNPSEHEVNEIMKVLQSPIMTTYSTEICNIWNQLLDENQRKELNSFYFETNGLGNIMTKKLIENMDIVQAAAERVGKEIKIFHSQQIGQDLHQEQM